jgi:arylsulfatase A-like enzyme
MARETENCIGKWREEAMTGWLPNLNVILTKPSRLRIMKPLLALSLILGSTLAGSSTFGADASPPNILFILTDDQRDNSFSAMGHPWIRTPNIDQLIGQSTRFTNTYIAEPTCMPSRAALLLGIHERINHLGFNSKYRMNPEQWKHSYPALLKTANYHSGFVGKWHVNTTDLEFEEMFDYWEGQDGHGPFLYPNEDASGGPAEITCNRYHTDKALRFLDTVPEGKPFCLSLCYAVPHATKVRAMHTPFNESASLNPKLKDHPIYGGMYRDLDIAYPLQHPEDPYRHIPQSVLDQDGGRKKTYIFDYEPAANKEHLIRYYQLITEVDQMVGEIIAELKKRGLSDNTLLIFASDHGVLLGEYGMGGKGLLYELVMKFPGFVFDPKAPAETRGQVRDEIVSSLDLTATILDYAGVAKTDYLEGVSLKPLVQSTAKVPEWRKGLFLENLFLLRDNPLQEGYVEDGWKYIRYYKVQKFYADEDLVHEGVKPAFEQLFDLRKDPEEKNNLIDAPEAAEMATRLRAKCEAEVTRLNQVRARYASEYLGK